MKLNHPLHKWIPAAALGLLLTLSPSLFAASDVTITIDSALSAWMNPWGPCFVARTYDGGNNGIYVQQTWTGTANDSYVCGTVAGCNGWLGCGPAIDGTLYESIEMDIMFPATNTAVLSTSDSSGLQIGFDHGYSMTSLTNFFPAWDGVWHHLSIPIPVGSSGIANFLAVAFYCWQPGGVTGTFDYEVKNLVVKAKVVPLPPPTMLAPEKVKSAGLWLGTYAHGGGTRNSVYTPITTGNGVSWVGVATPANPVTYSLTIGQYPDSAKYPGIQSHIFLSSDQAGGEGAPEWNSTNCIFFRIMNNADGSAYANFMFKTNAPGGWLDQIFGSNNIVGVTSTKVTGTWSVTFSNDTDCTITTPDNTKTNFTFPADALPYFSYVYASFGIQQNNDTYSNRFVVFSHAGISAPYSIDDYFTNGIPDTSFSVAGPQFGTQTVPDGSAWYAKYAVSATGFGLTESPDLVHWTDSSSTNLWEFDGYGWMPLGAADLTGADHNYFRMVKRTATQLQVLLPGEVNNPSAPGGKTGIPSAQTAGNPFDLRVNACDASWNIAKACSDVVSFTSSDTSAWLPPNTTLVKGSANIIGNTFFNASGTWTITATDTSTNTVAAGVSTAITIP